MIHWRLVLFLVGSLVLLTSPSGAQTPPPGEGVVSFWGFDRALVDRSGVVHDQLTARDHRGGAAEARFVDPSGLPGTVGWAVALGVQPGDARYLTAPVSQDLQLGPTYTIEAWVHPTELSTWNRLVLNWGGPPHYSYHVGIHNGTLSLCHNEHGGPYLFAEGGHVQTGRWQHVAAVARRDRERPSASSLSVFLDGQRVASTIFGGTIATLVTEGLGIGDSAGSPSPSARYRGYLDDLVIWKRALSEKEIRKRYEIRADELRRLEIARRAELFLSLERYGLEEIVFAERAPGRDPSNHYYANFGYSCVDSEYWIHGRDGGRLSKLDVRTGELTVLLEDPEGAVRDPAIHYDAEKILFSYRKGGTHHYNLYEIRVDGSELRQITRGPWDDIEPTYLPDGDIVFCSTRCKRYIGCWLAPTAILYRCDRTGGNLRTLSSGSFTENTPAVLPDGRLLYTRWEYVNRDPVVFHHLWTMNPDGTTQMVYFGNMHPGGVFIDARPIPGSDRVVFIHSRGHGRNEHAGSVATLSAKCGPDSRGSVIEISRNGDLRDPYPLSEDSFLVARGHEILLMDSGGQAQVLHTAQDMAHEPRPLLKRKREARVLSRVDRARTTAELFLTDVYRGRSMAGVKRGTIKKLMLLEDLPKPANFHGGGSQPIGHGVTSTLKRILGTVPVEPDGSAYFEVPALRSLFFVALDENELSVKQMRSFVTLGPGETTGCVGCHEPRTETPQNGERPGFQAMWRPPSRIRPIEYAPEILDFPRDVQPVLDRNCVRCHDHDDREGGVVLVGDRGPVFSLSYYELFLHWQVKDTHGDPRHGSGRQHGNDDPYTTYSSASPLMEKIDGSHHEVTLTPHERQIIRLWIDTSAQYAGTYAAYGTGQVGGCWGNNEPIRVMADDWPETEPAKASVERRCGACHPKTQLPRHVTARIPLDAWGDMLSWVRPLSRYSRHRLFNLSRPEKSLILLAPLSREAGGYAKGSPEGDGGLPGVIEEDRSRPPAPFVHPIIFRDTKDADYRRILAPIERAQKKLEEIKRFDMPGFKPAPEYVREMKRYGVLPPSFDRDRGPIDVYELDKAYWRSMWYQPMAETDR